MYFLSKLREGRRRWNVWDNLLVERHPVNLIWWGHGLKWANVNGLNHQALKQLILVARLIFS